VSEVQLALDPPLLRAVRVRLARLDAEGFAARLWRRDPALWGQDGGRRAAARDRLGWLAAPSVMRPQLATFQGFAEEVAAEGFREAVLLGMGGSGLAAEALRRSLAARPGALELSVLDSTSPAALRAALSPRDPAHTLFVVASKSGSTPEVRALERAAFEWSWAGRPAAARAFVAITDRGSPLERLARERSYRRVFLNPPDIGGRYSALSCFGLVPGGLIGADLEALLGSAMAEAAGAGAATPAAESPALVLGAALGELALAGRDKVTLLLGPPFEPLGDWIEQLLAESTGKQGRGLVPVVDEDPGPAAAYGRDRVFVALSIGSHPPALARTLARLAEAGHPVLSWTRPAPESLGAEFFRWQVATAVVGAVLEVNPFDEPDVAAARQSTEELLRRARAGEDLPSPPALAEARGIRAMASEPLARRLGPAVTDAADPLAWAAAFLGLGRPGGYVALLAFLHDSPLVRARLRRLRHAVREATNLATTLGYGPRYLHATGQLHKGGPRTGIFLQLLADEGDFPLPGERFGFRALQRAQALGDYRVLERRGRSVLQLDLGPDPAAALDALADHCATRIVDGRVT
jgi:glucose-6-phosphate isomerase